jgi:hypothetical protein
MAGRDEFKQVAAETPVDNSTISCSDGDNVQEVLEDLCTGIETSASPGFTWGKSGTVTSNTWLWNESVPSNKSGRTIFLSNATLERVFVSNEQTSSFNLEIYEHDGVTYTLLTTVSLLAARSTSVDVGSIPLTTGKELAMRLVMGSGKNITAGVLLLGDLL